MENIKKIKLNIDEDLFKQILSEYIQDDKIPKRFKTQRKLSEKFGVGRFVISGLLDEISKIPKSKEIIFDRKITNMQISFIDLLNQLYNEDCISLIVKMGLEITSVQWIYCLRKYIEDYKKEKMDKLK